MPTIQESLRTKVFQAFIDDNPSTIVLQRSARVSDGAGGWIDQAPVAQAAQECRIIYSGNKGDNMERILPDGSVLVITHRVVFMPGANVQRYDWFLHEGDKFFIGNVARVPTWRVACEAGRHSA